jgi:transcription termination factor NusA
MTTPVIAVGGIGAGTAQVLAEHGITNAEQLGKTSVSDLVAIPGFSNARAQKVIQGAKELLGSGVSQAPPSPAKAAASDSGANALKAKAKKDKKKRNKKEKAKDKKKGKKNKKGKKVKASQKSKKK